MFDVDPDEFVFGNDYNNNTVPDYREDDMKMDTPYDLDRQGRHFYFQYTPLESVKMYLGSFRTKGVGSDLRTNDDYFKLQVNYNVFDVGKLYAEYRRERIKDNIRDAYMQVEPAWRVTTSAGIPPPQAGSFERYTTTNSSTAIRRSIVFVESRIRAIPSITLENHLKFERNRQEEGVMYDNYYQPSQDINTFAMVNKIVYTKTLGNWQFSPGIKFRFYKKDRSESVRASDFYLMRIPLVMVKYIISPRTDVMLGLQGIPGFEFTFKDHVQSANDYEQKTYTLQLQNRTTYFGYQIWAATGIRYDEKTFTEYFRSFEDYKSSTLFVKIFLGY